jgi:hypothetical protein
VVVEYVLCAGCSSFTISRNPRYNSRRWVAYPEKWVPAQGGEHSHDAAVEPAVPRGK